VAEIAVAALAAGARLDDPRVALFRRPVEALIGTAPAEPGVAQDPAAFGPFGAAVGEGCSGSWNWRRTGRPRSSKTCTGPTPTPEASSSTSRTTSMAAPPPLVIALRAGRVSREPPSN